MILDGDSWSAFKKAGIQGWRTKEEDYAAHGGSFPINVAGAGIVGSVTISGLPQREDHNLVVEALCLLTGRDNEALRLKP